MADNKKTYQDKENTRENSEVSLVPLYSPLEVSRGLQAHRRGDVILYTVRGEPEKVNELLAELDAQGVNDVVALVSHRTDNKENEEITDAIIETPPNHTTESSHPEDDTQR